MRHHFTALGAIRRTALWLLSSKLSQGRVTEAVVYAKSLRLSSHWTHLRAPSGGFSGQALGLSQGLLLVGPTQEGRQETEAQALLRVEEQRLYSELLTLPLRLCHASHLHGDLSF